MKFFFIIQGEGRGHMTQAISLKQILTEAGHEIVQVVVGKSPQRKIPQFFFDHIEAPVELLESPNFVTDNDHKKVKVFSTLVHGLIHIPTYRKSISSIAELVKDTKPDVIVNFYDFLGGLYNFIHRPKIKFVCLAHQYLLSHPQFTFPKRQFLNRTILLVGSVITRFGADKILALSFQPFDGFPAKKWYVVPPLMRKEVMKLKPSPKGHLLVYMVNPGYGKEVQKFHIRYPDQAIHCFWDHKEKPKEWKVDDTLTFHQLDDKLFLKQMASCKGYVTTSGFESVCEAMYLGKPVMMVPVEGHFEQACNAIDAQKAGAGVPHHEFDISVLMDYLPKYENVSSWFRDWVHQNKAVFLKHLTQ